MLFNLKLLNKFISLNIHFIEEFLFLLLKIKTYWSPFISHYQFIIYLFGSKLNYIISILSVQFDT